TTSGIVLDSVRNSIVEKITTSGFQKAGLLLNNCYNISVLGVQARNNGFAGINVTGDFFKNGRMLEVGERPSRNITLRNCIVDSNPGDPTNMTSHSGNGIYIISTDKVLVDHCLASNNGWDMPHSGTGPIGIWASLCDSVTIQYSISYGNKSRRLDGGGFGLDGGVTNSIVQYCLSYDNFGAGYGIYQYSAATIWKK